MRLESLSITNFMTYAEKQTLRLHSRKLCLVNGKNGSGKSAVFDALVWCIFGKTVRGLKGDEVVNRFVGHDCVVRLVFSKNGVRYKLTRYRKHLKHKNAVELMTSAGVRLTGVSTDETQDKINAMLGMDHTAFTGVLCGQGVMVPFSSLTDAQAKEVIEKAVGISTYTKAAKLASQKAAEVGQALETWLDKRRAIRERTERIQTEIGSLLGRLKSLTNEKAERLKAIRKEIQAKEEEILTLQDKIQASHKDAERQKQVQSKISVLQTQRDTIHAERVSVRLEAEKLGKLLTERQVMLAGNTKTTCLVCEGPIDHVKLLALTNTSFAEHHDLVEKERTLGNKLGVISQQQAALEGQVKQLAKSIISDVPFWKTQIRTKQKEIEAAEDRHKQTTRLDQDVKELLEKAEETLNKSAIELKQANKRIKAMKAEAEIYKFWSKGFGAKGLRSLVLDSQLPFLNKKAARYSKILTNGNIMVSFRTTSTLKSGDETDKFGIDVVNKNGGDSYRSNSLGEQGKVDLVVGCSFLALQAARTQLNVVFLDEVFESLDADGIDVVLTLLTEELDRYESVFVVTHREELKDFFSNTIDIVKQNKVSRIVD